MRLFILTNMLTEDVSHIIAQRILWIFHPWLLRWRIVVMRYVS